MTDAAAPAKKNTGLNYALDYGPLIAFFIAYKFGGSESDPTQGPLVGTGVFMEAIAIAVAISKWKLGRVAPMLWLSAVLVVGFGAMTLWFRDPKFIQIKPTLIYLFFAALLIGGVMRGKAMLKYVLEAAYDGLSDEGWRKLSLNWGLFFLGLAAANEIMRAVLTFETWLTLKVWGITALTVLFAMANVPMLMRHGLSLGEEAPDNRAGDL